MRNSKTSLVKRFRKHGFRHRMSDRHGCKIIKNRRAMGRKKLTV